MRSENEINQNINIAFDWKKEGKDNAFIRNRLHHKAFSPEEIRIVLNGADDLLYQDFSNSKKVIKPIFGTSKLKAYVLILIGLATFIGQNTGLEITVNASPWLWFIPISTGLALLASIRKAKYRKRFSGHLPTAEEKALQSNKI